MNTENSLRISILPACGTGLDPAIGEQNKRQHIPQICYLLVKYPGVSMKLCLELSVEHDELL